MIRLLFIHGYYIKEIIEESGLSQKDFAKRLDTTPKNLKYSGTWEQSFINRYSHEIISNVRD